MRAGDEVCSGVWALSTPPSRSRDHAGVTARATSCVVRQRVNDLGLTAWFHPSVTVQRRGATAPHSRRYRDQRATCCTATSDWSSGPGDRYTHMGYVYSPARRSPRGLGMRFGSNRLQDRYAGGPRRPNGQRDPQGVADRCVGRHEAACIRTRSAFTPRCRSAHRSWDNQEGLPGRGDHRVIPACVLDRAAGDVGGPEWGGQRVWSIRRRRIISRVGEIRWALQRQTQRT